jgi:hypothetical protein
MLVPESSTLQTRYLITPTPGLRISIAFNVKTDEAGRS